MRDNFRSVEMGRSGSLVIALTLCLLLTSPLLGMERSLFSTASDGKISARIDNIPLRQALGDLTSKYGLELKGIPVNSDPVSLDLSDTNIEEILKRLLRGYNYVVIKPDASGRNKTVVMVLGKAQRSKYVDTPSSPNTSGITAPAAPPQPEHRIQQPQPVGAGQPAAPSIPPPATAPPTGPATGSPGTSGTPGATPSTQPAGSGGSGSRGGTQSSMDMMPPMPPQIAGFSSDFMPPMPPASEFMRQSASNSQTSTTNTGTSSSSTSQTASASSGAASTAVSSTGTSSSASTSSASSSSSSSSTASTSSSSTQTASTSTSVPQQGSTTSTTGSTGTVIDLRPPQIPF